jgi:transcriptional regulator with XRE-family HTH domain
MLIIGNYLDNIRRLLGQKIRERREEKGFKTQGDLAAKLGVDQSRISKWETGANLPDDESKQILKTALEVDDAFFDLGPNGQACDNVIALNEIVSFLAKLADLEPDQRNLIFALVMGDKSYLDGNPALAQMFSILSQSNRKER